jgi:hypothetical protein
MDESPNPDENEKPGARLDRIPSSRCKKRLPGAESGDGWKCSDRVWVEAKVDHDASYSGEEI